MYMFSHDKMKNEIRSGRIEPVGVRADKPPPFSPRGVWTRSSYRSWSWGCYRPLGLERGGIGGHGHFFLKRCLRWQGNLPAFARFYRPKNSKCRADQLYERIFQVSGRRSGSGSRFVDTMLAINPVIFIHCETESGGDREVLFLRYSG